MSVETKHSNKFQDILNAKKGKFSTLIMSELAIWLIDASKILKCKH